MNRVPTDPELIDLMVQRLHPLRVTIDAAGAVIGIDGDPGYYGYRLHTGDRADESIEFLVGMTELPEISLEAMQTPSGKSADIRWNLADGCGRLTLFDATQSHGLLQRTQQTANESQILEYRLKQAAEQLRRKQQELIYVAYHDALTGLYNRRQFFERLPEEIGRAERNGTGLSLLLIDIDHFKGYNDRYGHLSGDRCLNQVANVIGSFAKRPADVAARVGGEEFALLLPETNLAGAVILGQQICQEVYALGLVHLSSSFGAVSISIGAAQRRSAAGDLSWEAMFKDADAALYRAKAGGRNCVVGALETDA